MKRTLTAAATVLAGGAGVVGFAGTATAAEIPEFPAELPVDNNVAHTAYHFAGTLSHGAKAVGDVVATPAQPRTDASPLLEPAGDVVEGAARGEVLAPVVDQVAPKAENPVDMVGDVIPAGPNLPTSRAGSGDLPVNDVVDPLLGQGGGSPLGGAVGGPLERVLDSNGSTPLVGDALNNPNGGNPVGQVAGELPVMRGGHTPVDNVTGQVGALAGDLPVGRAGATPVDAVTDKVDALTAGGVPGTVHAVGDMAAQGPLSGDLNL